MEQLNISQVVEDVSTLEDKLLVLRLDLGKLRSAWERAFAPIANLAVPALDRAVRAITAFVNGAGQVIAALFGQVQKEAVTTTKVTGSAVKKALADFDQLDRLDFAGGGSGTVTVTVPAAVKEIPEQFQAMAERIQAILKPLREIDLSAAVAAFQRLQAAVAPLTRTLFSGLEWVWFNVLTPMAAWAAEQALPVFLDTLAAGFQVLGAALNAAKPVLLWLWESWLKPLGQWAGQALLEALSALNTRLSTLAGWIQSIQPSVQGFVTKLQALGGGFASAVGGLSGWNAQAGAMGVGLGLLVGLVQKLGGAFTLVSGAVSTVQQKLSSMLRALQPAFKTLVNGAIGVLNTAISGIESGINSMVKILNAFRVEIPKWVPGIGGKKLELGLSYVDLPSVPYLAQGAVLPANKPFLAMVGDQRHGTNVEAPLSTIQEAVAEVMGANLQGQDAAIGLLAQILGAIEGIQVGDDTIGRAARRYEQRMAVMGGVL